jgi:hypothetical protein
MKLIKTLITLLFLTIITNTYAECQVSVRYINGVWNKDQTEVNKVTNKIRETLSSHPSLCVSDPLFNPSQGYIMDLAETYNLKLLLEDGFWNTFKNEIVLITTQTIAGLISNFTGTSAMLEEQKVLDNMYVSIKSDIDTGKSVTLVAHSEGNLFALKLKQKSLADGYPDWKVKIVHLAPPTYIQKDASKDIFFLSSLDSVIGLLRSNKNSPNFIPNSDSGLGGHGMLSTYFNPNMTVSFTDHRCEVSQTNTSDLVKQAILRHAECQSDRPCVWIGFGGCVL